jgi:hypothetical protein
MGHWGERINHQSISTQRSAAESINQPTRQRGPGAVPSAHKQASNGGQEGTNGSRSGAAVRRWTGVDIELRFPSGLIVVRVRVRVHVCHCVG